jgi:hypothetical protein
MSSNLGVILGENYRAQKAVQSEIGTLENQEFMEFSDYIILCSVNNIQHKRQYITGSPLILDHPLAKYGLDSGSFVNDLRDCYKGFFQYHESQGILYIDETFTGSKYKSSNTTAGWTNTGSLNFLVGSYAESNDYNITSGSLSYYLTKFDSFKAEYLGSNVHKIIGSITLDGTNYYKIEDLNTMPVSSTHTGSVLKFKFWNPTLDAKLNRLQLTFYSTGSFVQSVVGSYNFIEPFYSSININTGSSSSSIAIGSIVGGSMVTTNLIPDTYGDIGSRFTGCYLSINDEDVNNTNVITTGSYWYSLTGSTWTTLANKTQTTLTSTKKFFLKVKIATGSSLYRYRVTML